MPESGDESQGIAVKGLHCPLGYPRSDLGRLRMIARRTGTMPRWPAPGTVRQRWPAPGTVRPGTRAPSCGSLGSHPPEVRAPYPKKVRGGRRARRPSGTALLTSRPGWRRGEASMYLPKASVAPGGGRVTARRAAPLSPRAGGIVHVRVCLHACGNDPSAGSPTETLLRLLLPIESQVWPSSRRPVKARRARAAPCRAVQGRAVQGPH